MRDPSDMRATLSQNAGLDVRHACAKDGLGMLDFSDPDYRRNPYPTLKRLRELDPLYRHPHGFWIATRHADVRFLNRDPRLGRDLRKLTFGGAQVVYAQLPILLESYATGMFHLDPPDHTRVRRLFSHAFTPAAVARMVASVERTARTLIAALPEEGSIELIHDVAKPFPVAVVGDILGVPEADYPALERWSFAISEIVELTITKGQLARAERSALEFKEYLRDFIERRRREPGDGLVDQLIAIERDHGTLSEAELIHNIMLLFVAGHETTTNLIGNGLYALLRHPDELTRLRQNPSLLPMAIEECLRYESPANATPRCAHEDIAIGGKVIRKGELVMCMLGAANRDPDAFADPDRLDITRDPNPHESFGGGIHYCIGAPLARLEGRLALAALIERYRHLEIDESRVVWADRVNLRGLSEFGLHVRQ
jgi:pimeloyl-[acyl-carrier protein] synthase